MKKSAGKNAIAILGLFVSLCIAQGFCANGQLLSPRAAMYPRAISLAHNGAQNADVIIADVTQFAPSLNAGIFESRNNGSSFQQIGSVVDPEARNGLCCTVIYELPVQIGSMPPGTLLWAGSLGQSSNPRRMSIRVWQSRDMGRTWTFLAAPAVADNNGGLWEPELSINSDGELMIFFSDETLLGRYSQYLAGAISKDGVHWSNRFPIVASHNPGNRPGMANVRKIRDNLYIMSYELCGVGGIYECAAHFRTSSNGINFGSPTDLGTRVHDQQGNFFAHAPTLALSNSKQTIAMAGQMLISPNGQVNPANGNTLFRSNPNQLTSTWSSLRSPVAVHDAKNDPCPNYSSAILFIRDDKQIFEISTDYSGPNCMAYYAAQNI